MVPPYAFVTLITSDAYLPGALALAAALKDLHPSPPIPPEVEFQKVCLVTPETVDVSTIKLLRRAYDIVIGVEVITQPDAQRNLTLLGKCAASTLMYYGLYARRSDVSSVFQVVTQSDDCSTFPVPYRPCATSPT